MEMVVSRWTFSRPAPNEKKIVRLYVFFRSVPPCVIMRSPTRWLKWGGRHNSPGLKSSTEIWFRWHSKGDAFAYDVKHICCFLWRGVGAMRSKGVHTRWEFARRPQRDRIVHVGMVECPFGTSHIRTIVPMPGPRGDHWRLRNVFYHIQEPSAVWRPYCRILHTFPHRRTVFLCVKSPTGR